MGVATWGLETWLGIGALATAVLGALGAGFRFLMQDRHEKAYERGWDRVAELDEEVRLLRIALHKAAQRGNDGWTALEVSLLAMPLPIDDRLRAVKQVRAMIERSLESAR